MTQLSAKSQQLLSDSEQLIIETFMTLANELPTEVLDEIDVVLCFILADRDAYCEDV